MPQSKETRATITLLIAEIQDCKSLEDINTLLECWIKANDLHPEEVRTFVSLKELQEYVNAI